MPQISVDNVTFRVVPVVLLCLHMLNNEKLTMLHLMIRYSNCEKILAMVNQISLSNLISIIYKGFRHAGYFKQGSRAYAVIIFCPNIWK